MNSPIYTSSSPSSVSSTPKTLLMNVIQSLNELIESRLSRMILHLLKTGEENSRVVAHLVSPSRNAIKICTVVTRFESTSEPNQQKEAETDMIFKAVLDVKIFGQVTTVEMASPVTFVGKFDENATVSAGGEQLDGPLLSGVKIQFNCSALLQEMIGRARMLTKKAVKDAAALSFKILRISQISGGAENSGNASEAGGKSESVGRSHASGNLGLADGGAGSSTEMLTAALKLKAQQMISNNPAQGYGGALSNDNLGVLAAALTLGQQGTLGSNQVSNSLNSNDSAGLLAAALKSGAEQAQQDSKTNVDMVAAALKIGSAQERQQQQGVGPASKLAQLSSLQKNSSFGLLNANSALSFGSFFGSLGNLRNDTFTNLLKSSSSLKNLANADWGLNHGGDSAALLRKTSQNAASTGGANAGGNANATFDFGNASSASAGNAQARNLLLSLAGAGGSDGGMSNNSMAAQISNNSIETMKNIVRLQDQATAKNSSVPIAAGLNPSQGHDIKQQMLGKLGEMLQASSTAGGASTNANSQYDLLRELLLKNPNALMTQASTTSSSVQQPQVSAQQPQKPQQEDQDSSKNYQGLFSWIEKDSMFLTQDKIKEQDRIHEKKEQASRQEPMPLRFFSSAEDGNLESVGRSLFGEKKRKGGSKGGVTKKKKG